jgi:hypothetical protein
MTVSNRVIGWKKFWSLSAALILGFVFLPLQADAVKSDLVDPYLQREFDWGVYVEARNVDHYLEYEGSRLHPLTRVRIYFRSFSRVGILVPNTPSTKYEELWYYRGKSVGLRRYSHLDIPKDDIGAVIVGQPADKGDRSEQSQAIANALVRVLLDLHLKKALTSVVSIPREQYDEVCGELGRYGFQANSRVLDGAQMSIHVRSFPHEMDEYLFFQK